MLIIEEIIEKLERYISEEKMYSPLLSNLLEENQDLIPMLINEEKRLDERHPYLLPFLTTLEEVKIESDNAISAFLKLSKEFEVIEQNYQSFLKEKKRKKEDVLFKVRNKEFKAAEEKLRIKKITAECLFADKLMYFFDNYEYQLKKIFKEKEMQELLKHDWNCTFCKSHQDKLALRYEDPWEELPDFICKECFENRSEEVDDYLLINDYSCINGCCSCCGCTCHH